CPSSNGGETPAGSVDGSTVGLGPRMGFASTRVQVSPSELVASPMETPAPYIMCHEPSGKTATLGAWGVVVSHVAVASGTRTGLASFVNVRPSLDCARPM